MAENIEGIKSVVCLVRGLFAPETERPPHCPEEMEGKSISEHYAVYLPKVEAAVGSLGAWNSLLSVDWTDLTRPEWCYIGDSSEVWLSDAMTETRRGATFNVRAAMVAFYGACLSAAVVHGDDRLQMDLLYTLSAATSLPEPTPEWDRFVQVAMAGRRSTGISVLTEHARNNVSQDTVSWMRQLLHSVHDNLFTASRDAAAGKRIVEAQMESWPAGIALELGHDTEEIFTADGREQLPLPAEWDALRVRSALQYANPSMQAFLYHLLRQYHAVGFSEALPYLQACGRGELCSPSVSSAARRYLVEQSQQIGRRRDAETVVRSERSVDHGVVTQPSDIVPDLRQWVGIDWGGGLYTAGTRNAVLANEWSGGREDFGLRTDVAVTWPVAPHVAVGGMAGIGVELSTFNGAIALYRDAAGTATDTAGSGGMLWGEVAPLLQYYDDDPALRSLGVSFGLRGAATALFPGKHFVDPGTTRVDFRGVAGFHGNYGPFHYGAEADFSFLGCPAFPEGICFGPGGRIYLGGGFDL
ncbi:MAG: hypothetical protein HYV02_00880 [Deltaproteobacteria bacterium]|nr:hypothetical protein [Deltaproteobacteria bacterium]